MTCIMSSGKTIAAILLAIMVDKKRINYDDLVTKHWSHFDSEGSKGHLKVCDILRHEGGMYRLHQQLDPSDAWP